MNVIKTMHIISYMLLHHYDSQSFNCKELPECTCGVKTTTSFRFAHEEVEIDHQILNLQQCVSLNILRRRR